MPIGGGFLCLGAPFGRYSGATAHALANPALNSVGRFDAAGVFVNLAGTSAVGTGFDLPLQLPAPPGGDLLPGTTWFFQCWFRDGTSSNLSNTVGIELE